jgi:transcriptional regulator with XRE-family HTH domain
VAEKALSSSDTPWRRKTDKAGKTKAGQAEKGIFIGSEEKVIMNSSQLDVPQLGRPVEPVVSAAANPKRRPLHRIQAVRERQGVSLRSVAQALGSSPSQLRREEEEDCDLTLSRLYQWQRALEVPVSDLLDDSAGPLSAPVLERARLVKLMKTVASIIEQAPTTSIRRMADRLVDQLVEIMPELRGVAPWPSVGQRRSGDEYGRIVERSYHVDWPDRD